jgi:hypothetical protein
MSKRQILWRYILKIGGARNKRNEIKAEYFKIKQKILSREPFKLAFDKENEIYLGIAMEKHYKIKNKIESVGYQEDGKYKIHNQDQRDEISNMIQNVIWRIRIMNALSILISFFVIATIVVIFGLITSPYSNIFIDVLNSTR